MIEFVKKSMAWAFAIITGIFMFVPEAFFGKHEWITQEKLEQAKYFADFDVNDTNIIIFRLMCFWLVWLLTAFLYGVGLKLRRWITFTGQNYIIRVEYGNIFKKKKCKRVINFDECYTTQVGNATADINPKSMCGQYLLLHSDLNINQLIETAQVTPSCSKSRYHHKTRYDSGTIVPNGDDLLMAFAKLDEKGKGRFFSLVVPVSVEKGKKRNN